MEHGEGHEETRDVGRQGKGGGRETGDSEREQKAQSARETDRSAGGYGVGRKRGGGIRWTGGEGGGGGRGAGSSGACVERGSERVHEHGGRWKNESSLSCHHTMHYTAHPRSPFSPPSSASPPCTAQSSYPTPAPSLLPALASVRRLRTGLRTTRVESHF